MDTEPQPTELFLHRLEDVFQAAGLTESQQRSATRGLVEAATSVLGPSERHLMAVELREGELAHAVYYDPVAATGFIASLIGGIAGAANPFMLGCAVVGCLASLKGLRDPTSRAEGLLFWVVYERPRHIASREQAEQRFRQLCGLEDSVQPGDFSAALLGLLDLGCIKQSDGNLRVDGVVIVY